MKELSVLPSEATMYRLPHVLIYTRVSTEEQAKSGESIGVQEQLCIESCDRKFGPNLYTYEVISDPGKSGSLGPIPNDPRPNKRKRKGLENALAGLQAGKYTHVCAFKSDRLYRNILGWMRFRELCSELNVELLFAAETYDSSIGGQFASDVVAQVAEFIRKQTVDNVQYALDARKRNGYWTGTPPFGWRYETAEESGEERPSIVHVPERLEILKRINAMFISGLSFEEIARVLNAEAVPQRYAVGRWQAATVRNALINHGHAGYVKLKSGELLVGKHSELRLWELSHYESLRHIVRRRRKRFKGIAATQPFRLFSGLAVCGKCGSKLRSEFSSNAPCYRCLGDGGGQSHVYVSARFLEAAVVGEMRKFSASPQVLGRARTEVISQIENEHAAMGVEREGVQKKLSHLRLKRSNLLDALSNGVISQADYREKVGEFESDYVCLSRRLDELTTTLRAAASDTAIREAALKKLLDFDAVWNALEDHERRELVHATIEKLHVCLENDRLFLRLKLVSLPEVEVPVQRGRAKWLIAKAKGPEGLTLRELAFLKHVLDGLKMSAIAELMDIELSHAYRLGDRAKCQVGVETYLQAAELSKSAIELHLSMLPLFGKTNRAFKPNPALTVMEWQVLEWRSAGLSCADIAARTDACPETVQELEARAFAKVGLYEPDLAFKAARDRGQAPRHIRVNSCRLDSQREKATLNS